MSETNNDIDVLKINVATILDTQIATKTQDAKILYDTVHPLLKGGRKIELDFTEIKIVISLFLNFSIGHLVKDCPMDNLTLIGLDDYKQNLVDRVLENAKFYYSQQESEGIELEVL